MTSYKEEIAAWLFPVDDENGMMIGPSGCHYDSKAEAMYFDQLRLCGCGNPIEVHSFLVACAAQFDGEFDKRGGVDGIEKLVQKDPATVAEFIAHFLDMKHITEHGGSVYGSWLTDRGKQFLELGAHSDADSF